MRVHVTLTIQCGHNVVASEQVGVRNGAGKKTDEIKRKRKGERDRDWSGVNVRTSSVCPDRYIRMQNCRRTHTQYLHDAANTPSDDELYYHVHVKCAPWTDRSIPHKLSLLSARAHPNPLMQSCVHRAPSTTSQRDSYAEYRNWRASRVHPSLECAPLHAGPARLDEYYMQVLLFSLHLLRFIANALSSSWSFHSLTYIYGFHADIVAEVTHERHWRPRRRSMKIRTTTKLNVR